MKRITALLIFCALSLAGYSQKLGLGLGNGGLNIKSNHMSRLALVARFNGSNLLKNNWSFSPSIQGQIHIFDTDNAKPYFGIGIGSTFASNNGFSYNTYIPIGVEVFPMGQKRFSLTVESGIGYGTTLLSKQFLYSGFRGLLEFTFYFGKTE